MEKFEHLKGTEFEQVAGAIGTVYKSRHQLLAFELLRSLNDAYGQMKAKDARMDVAAKGIALVRNALLTVETHDAIDGSCTFCGGEYDEGELDCLPNCPKDAAIQFVQYVWPALLEDK